MRTHSNIRLDVRFILVASLAFTGLGAGLFAGPARAGHNGSPALLKSAITSGSADAIEAELEHTEYLVCASCTDMVLPLVDNLDYGVRKAAAWWIARRGISHDVYVSMLGRLSQPDSAAARNAADVLGELAYPSAVPALSAALSNPIYSGEARAAMARALGSINRTTAVPALVDALGASEPAVKASSLAALRSIQGFKDATVAQALLTDADEQVRAEAALTYGVLLRTGKAGVQPASVDSLLAVLANDPSANVRKKAAWALGEMGASAAQALAGLQKAASSDASPLVRSLAQVAIGKLTR
jgi:HEAT repeat protein